jgi:hypothetical protein
MTALMTIRCARCFNWTGSAFSSTDKEDKIIPTMSNGELCNFKSQFKEYKGIIGVVLMASDKNMAYPEGVDKSHFTVTEKIKKFFNYAAEKDPKSVAYQKKKPRQSTQGTPSTKRLRLSPTKAS